jgi:leucyl/phenylalanyl-tRNA--protein transferase
MLDEQIWFPSPTEAMADGLLAMGGDLKPDRLLLAYRNGIFPWYNEDNPILWWSPDPRFVLYPEKLKISRSMQQVLKKETFEYRCNTSFEEVIRGCANARRSYGHGTWITDEVMEAYIELHKLGHAHSAECWQNGELVGGLYGVRLGMVFFGESMFSHASNASKVALIRYVQALREEGVKLIDCQMHTAHLESLGAEPMSRVLFLDLLKRYIR